LRSAQSCDEIIERLIHATVLRKRTVALPRKCFKLAVFCAHSFILQQRIVCPCDFLEEGVLLVVCLQYAVLMRSKFLELSFEDLAVLVGY
jgi:hypothetical protein